MNVQLLASFFLGGVMAGGKQRIRALPPRVLAVEWRENISNFRFLTPFFFFCYISAASVTVGIQLLGACPPPTGTEC